MINKRFMVSGDRVDNGEQIVGYYYRLNFEKNQSLDNRTGVRHYIICDDAVCHIFCQEVDPATVEPLAIPPTVHPIYGYEDTKPSDYDILCPTCEEGVGGDNDYCKHCGQRLDWTVEETAGVNNAAN